MRDPKRIDNFCDELKVIWKKLPDWRFAQLMDNFLRHEMVDMFYEEDASYLKKLKEYVDEMTGDSE